MRSVILASESVRRRELMNICGIPFYAIAAKIDEKMDSSLSVEDGAMKLALEKAKAISKTHPSQLVIGADTIVVVDHEVLGKPKDIDDARRMLRLLSNKTHRVITGVALVFEEMSVEKTFYEMSEVTFSDLSDEIIDWYLSCKEYRDKAGSYAIQGKGMVLVERLNGDYSNVVGLPMNRLLKEIKEYIEI